ncbi:Transcription initiation factor IIF subunit beta [Lecanosticta acicola]|uniref:Transcription initiation factor IIF subunit beta n=1 Tax=Lecanosticta acicola TaxID=111012 RepID=A0AAI8YWR8_9PEZI|nr:Transcription initiation factor IIF subunit beta [Lecanosticta acicola]
MVDVKPEIKVDSADIKLSDIDQFEEDTDLQLPSADAQSWLVKVSEDMWKAWNDIYTNTAVGTEPVEVGKLRVRRKPGEPDRIQIRLDNRFHQHKLLPRTYELEMKASTYNNTVVFSEKDLPGHRAQQYGGRRQQSGLKPSGIPNKNDRYGNRKPGTYASAIPKQTALAPRIVNEAVAKPVEDETSLDFFKMQYDVALNAGKKTNFSNDVYKNYTRNSAFGFSVGSMTSKPNKSKKKQPKEKAVRISKEELLDNLQQCFQQYQYWPLKALRERLQQPEAWIKEVLDEIAYAVRSGDYVGTYKLNESSARLLQIQDGDLKAEAAPIKNESDQGTGDELGEADDDDVDEFEDVKMEG